MAVVRASGEERHGAFGGAHHGALVGLDHVSGLEGSRVSLGLARLEDHFHSLPTFARVRCAEALTRHRGNPDALGILTRARERLVAHAGDNPAPRERVAPFVAQFDDWISATRPP